MLLQPSDEGSIYPHAPVESHRAETECPGKNGEIVDEYTKRKMAINDIFQVRSVHLPIYPCS